MLDTDDVDTGECSGEGVYMAIAGATVVEVASVPALATLLARRRMEAERPSPFVLDGLLKLLPSECGSDGTLYRRRATAEQAAERYAQAVAALRPRARLHWQTVPDGHSWRWWAVLLPETEEEVRTVA